MKPGCGSTPAPAAQESSSLPAGFGDDHLCAYFVKALPEFRSLQIHPRGLRCGQWGPSPGKARHGRPLRGTSRRSQRGGALQEAVLTAAWTAEGRDGEAVREREPTLGTFSGPGPRRVARSPAARGAFEAA